MLYRWRTPSLHIPDDLLEDTRKVAGFVAFHEGVFECPLSRQDAGKWHEGWGRAFLEINAATREARDWPAVRLVAEYNQNRVKARAARG